LGVAKPSRPELFTGPKIAVGRIFPHPRTLSHNRYASVIVLLPLTAIAAAREIARNIQD